MAISQQGLSWLFFIVLLTIGCDFRSKNLSNVEMEAMVWQSQEVVLEELGKPRIRVDYDTTMLNPTKYSQEWSSSGPIQ